MNDLVHLDDHNIALGNIEEFGHFAKTVVSISKYLEASWVDPASAASGHVL